jgi:hypothetical protein
MKLTPEEPLCESVQSQFSAPRTGDSGLECIHFVMHPVYVMDFKDLLTKQGFDLDKVMVLRHRPTEPALRKVLPWLAAERPQIFNAYQKAQNPDAEKALMKADIAASVTAQPTQNSKKGFFVVLGAALSAPPRILLFNSFDGELSCLGAPFPSAARSTIPALPMPTSLA